MCYNICIGDIMIRKQIYITNKQDKVFKKLASSDGTSASELMRRALDEYIDRKYPVYLITEKQKLVQQLTEPKIRIASGIDSKPI